VTVKYLNVIHYHLMLRCVRITLYTFLNAILGTGICTVKCCIILHLTLGGS